MKLLKKYISIFCLSILLISCSREDSHHISMNAVKQLEPICEKHEGVKWFKVTDDRIAKVKCNSNAEFHTHERYYH